VNPEYKPPAHLKDPLVRRLLTRDLDPNKPKSGRANWSRALRGRLPTLADYAVARALADYANTDGTNAHPGIQRLADDLNCSTKWVKTSLATLAETGWITRTSRGRRKLSEADTYSLSVPAPVAVELQAWRDDDPQWMRRPADEPRRTGSRGHGRPVEPAPSRGSHVPLEPPVSRGSHVPLDPTSRGTVDASRGTNEGFLGEPEFPPPGTYQDLHEHHSDRLDPPHADARGADTNTSNPWGTDEDDVADTIADVLEHQGYDANHTTIGEMLAAGYHPNAVLNTVKAQQA
jgi:hypothetical protein